MSEQDTPIGANGAAPADSGPMFTVEKIYLKDVSFEAPSAPQVFNEQGQPQLQMNLSQKVQRLSDNAYEVVLGVTLTCTLGEKTAYLAEVQQAGVFGLAGFDEQTLRIAARVGIVELMLSGCTTVADHHYIYYPGMGFDPSAVLFDEAEKLGHIAAKLATIDRPADRYREIKHMGDLVAAMVHGALDAFARLDVNLALDIARRDRLVDEEYDAIQRQCITFMMEDPRTIRRALDVLWVARALERVGDHAKNICEYVIYMALGKDVRHLAIEDVEQQLATALAARAGGDR